MQNNLLQVVASAVLSINAEITASRARLQEVLARLDVAEKDAIERENFTCNQPADIERSNYYQGRNIQFEDAHEEEDYYDYHHMPQGWIFLYRTIKIELLFSFKL